MFVSTWTRFHNLFPNIRKLAHAEQLFKGLVHEPFLLDLLPVFEFSLLAPLPNPPEFKGFRIFMMVAWMKSLQFPVFLEFLIDANGVRPLQPGDQCWPVPLASSAAFHDAAGVALDLAEAGVNSMELRTLKYHFLELTTIKVDDLASVPANLGQKKRQAQDSTIRLVQAFDAAKRRKCTAKAKAKTPKCKKKAGKLYKLDPDDNGSSVGESELDESSRSGSSSSSSSKSSSKSRGGGDCGALAEAAVAVCDLLEEEPPPEVKAAIVEASTESELVWSDVDYQVRDSKGEILGRLTMLHKDSPKAAISCYCRMHQCCASLMWTPKAPAHSVYLEWLRRGRELPRGKDSKGAHMAIWRDLTRS